MSVAAGLRDPRAHAGTALCLAGVGLVVLAGNLVVNAQDTADAARVLVLVALAHLTLHVGKCVH